MHLVVLYPLDANTYQYGEHMVNMERKQMKCGYPSTLPSEKKKRNIISVIKQLFGEHFTSRSVKMQRELLVFRCIGV
jgi:hypothetical protein